jgi:adenylylsulfate kinase
VSDERGFCLWFTGLSGSGKSTISEIVVPELQARGAKVEVLDGDVVRMNLSKGLGFSKEDRDTNILRIGWVAEVLVRNGVVAVVSAISPYNEARETVRQSIGDFVEVYVKASLEELTQHRDPKGLYAKAIAGEIDNFTGVSDPYEAPENPELVIDTETCTPEEAAQQVFAKLEEMGLIADPVDA